MIYNPYTTAIQDYIDSKKGPAGMWKTLRETSSASASKTGPRAPLEQFTTKAFDKYGSIAEYVGRLQLYRTKLASASYATIDRDRIHHLTNSVPLEKRGDIDSRFNIGRSPHVFFGYNKVCASITRQVR